MDLISRWSSGEKKVNSGLDILQTDIRILTMIQCWTSLLNVLEYSK